MRTLLQLYLRILSIVVVFNWTLKRFGVVFLVHQSIEENVLGKVLFVSSSDDVTSSKLLSM